MGNAVLYQRSKLAVNYQPLHIQYSRGHKILGLIIRIRIVTIPCRIHFFVADQDASTILNPLTEARHTQADKPGMTKLQTLYTESHNRVDYIIVILLQCLDSLLP